MGGQDSQRNELHSFGNRTPHHSVTRILRRLRVLSPKGRAEAQQGNILFASLMLLLVMNLLGIGLMQSAMKEQEAANFKRVDSTLFHLTESCARDAMAWLKGFDRPPEGLPHTITYANLNHLTQGGESQQESNQMQGYSYNCTITELLSKSSAGEPKGSGESISVADGYEGSGDLTPKFYYRIEAAGAGPDNALKRITTLVSLTY